MQLETPRKYAALVDQAHQMAVNVLRPNSRKYDRAEHSYPKELDIMAAVIDGMNKATGGTAGASHAKRSDAGEGIKNGGNLATVYSITEVCWGDVGLVLTIPRQGLGNAAIAAVASEEQLARFGDKWVAMAITEPHFGSDSAAVRTTAVLDGDQWVLNGEKIYVTAGERAEALVVWATLDKTAGRAAIKPFLVPRNAPGLTLVRLEKKLGIRASDTAAFSLVDCRIPKANLLGSAEIDTQKGFGGVMQTFDNTRPLVAAMALGVARAALDETRARLEAAGVDVDDNTPPALQTAAAAALQEMEADWTAARLLTLKAAWMADNRQPNALQASMAKAKAGRMVVDTTLRCVELCSATGYGEDELLEKWARDAKILDIFEGTQQIQVLIVARRLLNKSSKELR
ncbi:MAG TPA: acyl-CoA dehydrogenase family protein [Verrucomicrobiae bacterium]|nr:acyl-CoA dehydrogenase family protein [Verrucomicrobiae bacterium]